MSGFPDSFDSEATGSRHASSTRPFDDDGYLGYDPRLPSQRFDTFSDVAVDDSSVAGDDMFVSQATASETTSPPPPIYVSGSGGFSSDPHGFSPESNGKPAGGLDGVFSAEMDGSILPPPSEMQPEEGFALREWRRCVFSSIYLIIIIFSCEGINLSTFILINQNPNYVRNGYLMSQS